MVGHVTDMALGTAQWGLRYGIANTHGEPTLAEVEEMLAVAWAGGARVLDTARAYGRSEAVIGALVGDNPRWRIITKLAPNLPTQGSPYDAVVRAVDESLAQSCKALRRAALDVMLVHRAHHRTDWDGVVWERLQVFRAEGRVLKIGVSAQTPEHALAALDDASVDVIQVAASLLDQRLERANFFTKAAASGKEVLVRSVLLQGVAALPPEALPRHLHALRSTLDWIADWAGRRGEPTTDVFIRYACAVTNGTLVIGAEAPLQVRANLRACQCPPLAAVEAEELRSAIPQFEATQLDPALWPSSPGAL